VPELEASQQLLPMITELCSRSQKPKHRPAIRYALTLWPALTRYCDDGRLEADNNAAERASSCT
jgi:hypothetical protein